MRGSCLQVALAKEKERSLPFAKVVAGSPQHDPGSVGKMDVDGEETRQSTVGRGT